MSGLRVTEERNPLDAALDLVFYAPIGLAITAAEEVPKLAAKGRRRFTSQWTTARVVGQFAVSQGRRQAAQRFSRPEPSATGRPTTVVGGPVGVPPAGPAPSTSPAPPSGPEPSVPLSAAASPVPVPAPGPAGPVPTAHDLAIPDYDSLSASQVVQRLAGLAEPELDAVGRYEAGTRGRRTILTRVAQLQGS